MESRETSRPAFSVPPNVSLCLAPLPPAGRRPPPVSGGIYRIERGKEKLLTHGTLVRPPALQLHQLLVFHRREHTRASRTTILPTRRRRRGRKELSARTMESSYSLSRSPRTWQNVTFRVKCGDGFRLSFMQRLFSSRPNVREDAPSRARSRGKIKIRFSHLFGNC
jgi:hypothetical protein